MKRLGMIALLTVLFTGLAANYCIICHGCDTDSECAKRCPVGDVECDGGPAPQPPQGGSGQGGANG